MTFRRFVAWVVEKLLEMQCLVLLLIAVKFLLPTDPASYRTFDSFVIGAQAQWLASLDEAAFMTSAFMNGSYLTYFWKTWQAANWLVGIHFYFWSFYLFTSIFACLGGQGGYLGKALLAFLASAGVLAWRQRHMLDTQMLYAGAALVAGGLIVILSAVFGGYVDARLAGRKTVTHAHKATGRMLDFSH